MLRLTNYYYDKVNNPMKQLTRCAFLLTVFLTPTITVFSDAGYQELNVSDAFGQQQFHLKCAGEGSPSLLLDAGSKYWSDHYVHLLTQLAELTHTCLFDRPGYGQSSLGKFPRTSQQIADDMASVIEAAGLETPLIVAGHSLGGINALSFAALHREQVAGIILIDSAHPQQYQRFDPALVALQKFEINRFWKLSALQGAELKVDVEQDISPWLDVGSAGVIRQGFLNGTTYVSVAAELEALDKTQKFLETNFTAKLEVPLVVLTAKNSFDLFEGVMPEPLREQSQILWMELQAELMNYGRNAIQLFSEGNHALEYSDPDSILNALERILQEVK